MKPSSPADFYHKQLLGSGADTWLVNRGIFAHSAIGWKLGFVGAPLKGDEDYVGCLTIPYFTGLGSERGMRFRPLYDNPQAKYLSRPKDSPHLFGVMYSDSPKVYIAEGELDAITLWQMGFAAVGVPGAQAWRHEWRWLFRNCEEVIVVFDPDDGGVAGASKVYRSLERITYVRSVKLPRGSDVNDLYNQDRKKLGGLLT